MKLSARSIPMNLCAHRWSGEAGASVGAIDVHPQVAAVADLGDAGEIVDDAEVGGARRRDGGEQALVALLGDRSLEVLAGQSAVIIGVDLENVDVHHLRGGHD